MIFWCSVRKTKGNFLIALSIDMHIYYRGFLFLILNFKSFIYSYKTLEKFREVGAVSALIVYSIKIRLNWGVSMPYKLRKARR